MFSDTVQARCCRVVLLTMLLCPYNAQARPVGHDLTEGISVFQPNVLDNCTCPPPCLCVSRCLLHTTLWDALEKFSEQPSRTCYNLTYHSTNGGHFKPIVQFTNDSDLDSAEFFDFASISQHPHLSLRAPAAQSLSIMQNKDSPISNVTADVLLATALPLPGLLSRKR